VSSPRGGHSGRSFQSTRDRVAATDGLVLVLHDTTEFTYQRERSEAIGITKNINSGRDKTGRLRSHTVCGILMHPSLAVTTEGLPLGLTAVKFWTRKKFKGTAALKKKINSTRVPIEKKESIRWLDNLKQSTELLNDPGRCVHIGDRESDIYELFCAAQQIGTHFPVRPVSTAWLRTGITRLPTKWMRSPSTDCTAWKFETATAIRTKLFSRSGIARSESCADRQTKAISRADVDGDPRRGAWETEEQKENRVEADHRSAFQSRQDAVEKLEWHALRWKIELFHKILKSGCKAEESKLRTAQRLANLVSIFAS
jgi:hypothetical protein